MSVDFDASELNTLVGRLDESARAAMPQAEAVVKRGALNVKNQARDLISGLAHAPHYPRSISYDVEVGVLGVEAEIGPDKDRMQGALGNILEYGTANNAPFPHLGPALDREAPRFMENIERIVRDVL